MMGVELHDVPEDRTSADFDHGLGLEMGLFADARSESTRENDGFHDVIRSLAANETGALTTRHRARVAS